MLALMTPAIVLYVIPLPDALYWIASIFALMLWVSLLVTIRRLTTFTSKLAAKIAEISAQKKEIADIDIPMVKLKIMSGVLSLLFLVHLFLFLYICFFPLGTEPRPDVSLTFFHQDLTPYII